MHSSNVIKKVLLVALFFLFLVNSCSIRAKSADVIYLIPKNFEGGVVIFYDQKDGITPDFNGTEYVFIIPKDDVIKTSIDAKTAGGKPSFFLVDENGKRTELEYLYPGGPKYPDGLRTVRDISNEERDNKVFAMIYEQGNFNAANRVIYYRSFLIGKPKDGNLFASRDLNEKIANFQRAFTH